MTTSENIEFTVQPKDTNVLNPEDGQVFSLEKLCSYVNKTYQFSPNKTQSILEKLHTKSLLSYPRTDSEVIPFRINRDLKNIYISILLNSKCKDIQLKICKLLDNNDFTAMPLSKSNIVVDDVIEGNTTYQDHSAIIPVIGNLASLDKDSQKIYDLVVSNFLNLLIFLNKKTNQ